MGELRPQDRIESLVVEERIGRGAFGSVYRARDERIGRLVALKVVELPRHAAPEERARVLREARAVGRLSSPHIVTLYRVHEDEEAGRWIFEMEYVEGGTLAQRLDPPRPLPIDEIRTTASGIAAALDAAHRAGIVHGDVKPGNVLFDGAGHVKLADFGLSRLLEEPSASQSSARFEGTPLFMAPEVILGQRASPASDVWGFGVCLYRMLAGRLPFDARGLAPLFHAIQHADPRPLPATVPPHLAALAMACLEKRAERRPASFAEVRASLEEGRVPAVAAVALAAREPRAERLLGRAGEIARIDAMIDAARSGTGGCVFVTGPQGIGCSSLARHALSRAGATGFANVTATVTPLRGVLRPLLEATRACIEGGIASSLEEARFGSAGSIARRLLDEEASVKLESREQSLWALEQLLGQLAREFRLLAVIEDFGEAQAEDAKALDYLAQRIPAAGGLLVVICRLDGPARGGGEEAVLRLASRPGTAHLPLGPLSREDAYRQLQQVADAGRVDPEVARRIHAVAQGNPLFAAELYRELASSGAVAVREGALLPGPGWTRATFPGRLLDLCGARLGHLAEEQRELLDLAAVDGLAIDGEMIAALLGEPLITVLRRLQQIYRQHGFLEPDRQGFRFANALYREALYRQLAPGFRRELHLQIARHLEGSEAARRDPERAGRHWEQGGDIQRAREHLLKAAERAAKRQELERAIDLARRGGIAPFAIDDATALRHAELIIPLADCYHGTGHAAEAEAMLGQVTRAAIDSPDLRDRAFTLLTFLRHQRQGVTPEEERELGVVAGRSRAGNATGKAHYILGTLAKHRGQLKEAERRFRLADELFVSIHHDSLHSSALDQLASVALRGGRLQEARALYFDAARVASHAGSRTNSSVSRINAALASLNLGELDGIAGVLEGCITELDLEGAENLAAHARILLANVRYSEGDLAAAEATATAALERLEKSRYLPGLSTAHAALARLRAVRGDLAAAEEHIRRGLEAAQRAQSRDQEMSLHGLAALVAIWRGAGDQAAAAARKGLEIATAQGKVADEFVLSLAECALYAPPLAELETALELLRARNPEEGTAGALAVAVGEAMLPRGSVSFEAASDALLREDIGEGRAALRLIGLYLKVLAYEKAGNRSAAYEEAQHARTDAHSLGHRWLELRLLDTLCRLSPTDAGAAEWRRLRGSLEPASPSGSDY